MTWLELKAWIIENAGWLGFAAMSLVGAVVGHIKAYEASTIEWEVRKHLWDLARRVCYACFIAMCIYFGYQYFGLPQPVAFILTGVFSVFGSETIDFFYAQAKQRFSNANNKPPAGGNNG